MRSKSHFVALLFCVVAFLGVFAGTLAFPAQSDPFRAPYIDNQSHSIAANSDLWFKFDYGVTNAVRNVTFLTLVNGTNSGVRFEVWAPEILDNWWQKTPTGRGTAASLDCATGLPNGSGECKSNDLTWAGAFGLFGTYYVRVVNDNSTPSAFQLVIQGDSVTLAASAVISIAPSATLPVAPSIAQPVPPQTATPPVAGSTNLVPRDDPNFAVPIDGQAHTLQPNTATWYRFDYSGANAPPRPIVSLRLSNGILTGIQFEVWAGENVKNWFEQKPVGRGTQEVITNCFATAPEATATPEDDQPTPTLEPTATPTGHCVTNDLTWAGAFGANGVYYVRVINPTSATNSYVLTMQ